MAGRDVGDESGQPLRGVGQPVVEVLATEEWTAWALLPVLLDGAGHKQRLEEARLPWHPALRVDKPGLGCEAGQPVPAECPVGGPAHLDAPFSACRELEVLQVVVLAVVMPVPELEGDGSLSAVDWLSPICQRR
ncbi:hypothetical protein GCM10010347_66660 [Streptomyces cirratus]|uniref:Uncharacterized protein n=1 Tax=Streptomyces cirratus TaxID=68187 RepID=A0ABQ3F5V1_9ACTN|nr:hypothetical protein GCM10010347_66660 [Streptomyces cirratus]